MLKNEFLLCLLLLNIYCCVYSHSSCMASYLLIPFSPLSLSGSHSCYLQLAHMSSSDDPHQSLLTLGQGFFIYLRINGVCIPPTVPFPTRVAPSVEFWEKGGKKRNNLGSFSNLCLQPTIVSVVKTKSLNSHMVSVWNTVVRRVPTVISINNKGL